MEQKSLVLSGHGLNCGDETKFSIEKAGGSADIVHLDELISRQEMLGGYGMLVLPGGFAHGDYLGAGKVLANKLLFRLRHPLESFVSSGKLVLGIGNGFQALAKLGLLPLPDFTQRVSFTANDSGKFEGRWAILKANPLSPCIFTKGLGTFHLPVRHGEGKLVAEVQSAGHILKANLHALQYVDARGTPAGYPHNPDGSFSNIAGVCDQSGRIFGVMPHPESFNHVTNHPLWQFGIAKAPSGLSIFANAQAYLSSH